MYFKDRNDTNIDSEFKNTNNLSYLLSSLNKYKMIIIGVVVVILLIILMCFFFINRKVTNYLILEGEENITLYQGTNYIEPGYDAYNSKNEDLNSKVIIRSTLDMNNIGEYEITYTIGDITKTRIITVIEKPKEYTYIYLKTVNNDINVYLKINEEYVEPGYQVFSSTGLDLTNQVKVTGDVDISKKGTYKLIYSVIDSNNVTITATRTVIVMDSEISLSLSNDEYTNKDINIEVKIMDNYFDYMILPDNTKVANSTYSYSVSENGKYTFTIHNKKGMSKEESIDVTNIDKTLPVGSCSGSYKDGKSTIILNASDNVKIKKYEINGKEYVGDKIIINQELEDVSVKIYDISGNMKNISCTLKNNNTLSPSSKPSSSSSSNKPSSSSFSSKPSSSSSSSKPSSSSSSNNSSPVQLNKNISVNLYKKFSYWLYLPDKVTKNLPIVVYLPGLGEKGNDYNTGSKTAIKYGPINEIKDHNYSYNAIIVHMQVPSGDSVNNYLSDYIALINNIANEYNANKNKISIIGLSHGCYGLVNMLQKYPKYFSAAVFVGCGPNKRIDIKKFTYQAIWTFVGSSDGTRDYSDEHGNHYSLENFVSQINSSGGNARHTSVKEKANVHNIMDDNYSILRDSDYNVINWMISQTK